MPDANGSSALLSALGGGTGIAAVVGAVFTALQFFKFSTHRDKVAAARKAFDDVVASLGSSNEVERLAGAILLRRFFDPDSEVTSKGTPFAAESVNVIAALLRGQASGNFQKLLADGLAFAPSLRGADLQRTNLQNAYLGVRDGRSVDLSGADFYRADLTGASLKGANASGAVFYPARLTDAVFRKTDLTDANFFGADCLGAHFDGARLAGARFEGATNLPEAIKACLTDGRWTGPDVFIAKPSGATAEPIVYLSKPGLLDARQEKIVSLVAGWIAANGLRTAMLDRPDYPATGVIAEVRRRMANCAGAVVFGFAELEIADGLWRQGTPEEKRVDKESSPTPWSQIEAGMAAMSNLPLLLVVEPKVVNGIFDPALCEHNVFRVPAPPDRLSPAFTTWLTAVGERTPVA